MKLVITSIVCRLLYLMAVLGFTLALVLVLHNPWYLWCLLSALLVGAIPEYTLRTVSSDGQDNKERETED